MSMEQMKLTFVNVGYGEAMLIECPDPNCIDGTFVMIIDGGSAESEEYIGSTSGRVPFSEYFAERGIRHIDLMVSTHIHEDHLCGLLPVVRRTIPAAYWQALDTNGLRMKPLDLAMAETVSHRKFMNALNDSYEIQGLLEAGGCQAASMKAGDSGERCEGLQYAVLAPGAERCTQLRDNLQALYDEKDPREFVRKLDALDRTMNNYSLILMLDYKGTRILLPGDTNCQGFSDVPPENLQAHIYKIGHHGQKDGADSALLEKVQPKAVVCCASSDRRYDSAYPQMLAMIAYSGAQLWFSDCPVVDNTKIPPHQALAFTVDAVGDFSAEYIQTQV